ncbi:MAG TPA: hypothetical protein VHQ01_02540 [Pyrinomonadaceae bacterium]|nr:hypothetical protein [Pyrinomonadaceae bacterium]
MVALAAIWLFIKRAFWFVVDNWRIVLPAVVLIAAGVFVYRACNRPPKLDEKAIQKSQTAIAKQDRDAMIQILAESDTKEAEVDSNIKAIENARDQAKQNYTGKSNDDLAEELNRRASQP